MHQLKCLIIDDEPLAHKIILEYAKDILTRFEYWRLALGLLIIFVVVVAPEGIVGTARKVSERIGLSGNKDAPS